MRYILGGIVLALLIMLFTSWLTLNIVQATHEQGIRRMHEQRQLIQRREGELIWQNFNSGKLPRLT
jgi:hypothetical protein